MSKEEIEKDKIHLRNLSEDALKCENNELIGIDAYAVGSIARILQYIQQLETKQQKVIDKLEHDNKIDNTAVKKLEEKRRTATSDYYKNSYQTQIHKLNAKIEVRKEILKSIKGEEK